MSRARSFRKRNALALHEHHHSPNMTPMVDVVMVILVFFMASASVLGPEWLLRTALPPAKPTPVVPTSDLTRIELLVTMQGTGAAAHPVVTTRSASSIPTLVDTPLEDVTPWLVKLASEKSPKDLAIVVRPRPEVAYEAVVKLHEICAKLGVEKIGLLDPGEPAKPK